MKPLYTLLLGAVAVLTFNTASAFTSLVVEPPTPVIIKEPKPMPYRRSAPNNS